MTSARVRLVLASASPARRATLRAAGVCPEVVVSDVDETGYTAEDPEALALRLAVAKATAVAQLSVAAGAVVVGCDSVLDLDGVALGKPVDAEEAVRRWTSMRGRSGTLVTGHCVVDTRSGKQVEAVARTQVTFADVTDAEIEAYVATGEPLAVAGAFTIDGLGGAFVTGIAGDHHNVVGLSLPLLRRMLLDLDIPWTDLWSPTS
ncbi:MAG TPA: nucleoside triphosphate pyrophosphatase [Nocardioidaceae bacterium]